MSLGEVYIGPEAQVILDAYDRVPLLQEHHASLPETYPGGRLFTTFPELGVWVFTDDAGTVVGTTEEIDRAMLAVEE